MTSEDKQWCLNESIEIIKEYARGGAQHSCSGNLETVYEKLKELRQDAQSEG